MTLFNTIVASSATDNNEWYLLGLKESVNAAASILAPLLGAWLYTLFSQQIFIIYAAVASVMVLIIFTQLQHDHALDQ
jgi:MFS family permease